MKFGSDSDGGHPGYLKKKEIKANSGEGSYGCYPTKIEACSKKNESSEFTLVLNTKNSCGKPKNPTTAECTSAGVELHDVCVPNSDPLVPPVCTP